MDTRAADPQGDRRWRPTTRDHAAPQGAEMFYELNVRGYTMRHPSVQGPLRGTIAGLTTQRVIDHFKYLGVDVVRADADRGLDRRGTPAGARADQCLGLQPGDLFRARPAARAARPAGAAHHDRHVPQGGHLGDPRRGLQPHRRGRRRRADAVDDGARRQDLLPLRRSRRETAPRQRHGHGQHAALRPSRGAATS